MLQLTCLCIRHTFVEGHSYGKFFVRNSVELGVFEGNWQDKLDAGHKARGFCYSLVIFQGAE